MLFGDNVDTIKPDGLQFLTFKLSFNDYYAQDISNKIKSVKQRKIEKGEYQAGIPPYGYKKDDKQKNHLIPDEYSSEIVKEIFDMYVNKGMSTVKIADELNKREILPPAVYLKIPTYMKKKSVNPSGKYVWLRAQIGKILKNEVYLGHVVGRKFQKVSHKIAKVRCTKKEEHIVMKNMHTPIIDLETWNKAQEKINRHSITRNRKYEHPLKGIIYCGECGNKATIRYREEKRKNQSVWKATYFICSKRNNYASLCDCKQISASLLEYVIYENLEKELKKIVFSKEDIDKIYKDVNNQVKNKEDILHIELKKLQERKDNIDKNIQEIYLDKINKIIQIEDFEVIYKKMIEQKNIVVQEIEQARRKIEQKKESLDVKDNDIKLINILNTLLDVRKHDKVILEKLVNKVSFNKKGDISIKFTFKKIY